MAASFFLTKIINSDNLYDNKNEEYQNLGAKNIEKIGFEGLGVKRSNDF